MALSRRDFVKLCSGTVAGFGVSQMFHPAIHEAFAQTLTGERPPVFWVQGQGCTGCSVTLLNSTHPSIADVLLKIISLEFHPTVMAAEGEGAYEHMMRVAEKFKGKFIFAVEGAVPVAHDGKCCVVAEADHHEVTMTEVTKVLAANAAAVLVTDSRPLAEAVQNEVERQLTDLPRRDIAQKSLEANGKILVTKDLAAAVEAANRIAPEHLELCVDDPFALLPLVKNAGSVFLGRHTPEALGDYFAGPNHTLPTSGTARFSSPLSVDDFVKKTQFIYYTREALADAAPRIADFAEREGLHGHARSALSRTEEKGE